MLIGCDIRNWLTSEHTLANDEINEHFIKRCLIKVYLALKLLQTVLHFKDQVSEARLRTFCLAIVCSRDSSYHRNSAYQLDADPLRYPAAEHTALALRLRGTSQGLL